MPNDDRDIPIIFFEKVFGQDESGVAYRVMSAAIALSILGNIVVMTFTASKVKQEIAKEAIIPWPTVFGSNRSTPWAWIQSKLTSRRQRLFHKDPELLEAESERPEQTPMAALALHWFTAVLLIAVTAKLSPDVAWRVLVNLYSYVIRIMFGFFTAAGLLYLKLGNRFKFLNNEFVSHFKPWGGPTAAIIYALVTSFLLVTAWLPPQAGTQLAIESESVKWYIVPAIGISSLTWGIFWYAGLHFVMWKRGEVLEVERLLHCEKDDAEGGEWVVKDEAINHRWTPNISTRNHDP